MSGDKDLRERETPEGAHGSAESEAATTTSNSVESYVDRIIARARELKESDAFAAPLSQVGIAISTAQAKATTAMHGRNKRRITVAFVLAMVVIVLISLCLPYYGVGVQGVTSNAYTPDVVLSAYGLWFRLNVFTLFDPTLTNQSTLLLASFADTYGTGVYTLIINRATITFLVILCGIMLAMSGMLFQTAFRNPLAAPTMLGVSDGVTLGGIIYCMSGFINISDKPEFYALLVYGLGAAAVIIVLLASRLLSGGKRYSVLDMLLLGTVLCQLLGGVNQFIQNFIMDESTWANFYNIQQAANALVEPLLQVILIVVFVITFAITCFLRYRFNLIAFENDEGEMMGARTGLLRGLALVIGSIMQLAALASIGQVAMLSMAVPFLVRYLMPADFRSQMLGNCLVGSIVLLICIVVQHFIVIGAVTVPIGTIVSIFIVPFFVWIVAFSRDRWV